MKWDLTYLFENDKAFEEAFNELPPYVAQLASYKGKLHEEKSFVEFKLLSDEVETKLLKIFQYAHLKNDLNKKDVVSASNLQKVYYFLHQLMQSTSFESPEILSLGEETVFKFIDNNPQLEQHRFGFEKLFHMNEHVLDESKEQLLSYFGTYRNAASDLYDNLSTADKSATFVKLSDGRKVSVTQGNWRSLVTDAKNAKDRKKVFEAIFNYYEENKNTFANIYQLAYQMDLANTKARKFNSILEAHLFNNNIPTEVYTNLVEVASTQNKSLKKYIKLRKKYLGLKNHFTYDRFLSLAHSDKKYSYDDAKELFFT